MNTIQLRGVRTHNLKNIDLDIPRDQLIVITGLSGSGKSSLAFDTLYAEGQRRYVESLSSYARQFLSMMEKPEVDLIEGLSPAIAIEQKSASHNPRSTVGTITEIHDYLRLLYARVGEPRCPQHGYTLALQTISQMVDSVMILAEGTKVMVLAPVIRHQKGEHVQLLRELQQKGFIRARIDGEVVELENSQKLDLRKNNTIEVVIDRVKVRDNLIQRLSESFETAVNLTNGLASIVYDSNDSQEERIFSSRFACPECGYSLEELAPRLFSFNSPQGACPECDGLGVKQYFDCEKIIQNPELTLAGGAIRGWDKRNFYYFQLLESLANHYKFDVNQPYQTLPDAIKKVLLYGSGEEIITFRFLSHKKEAVKRKYAFEGIIANFERRFKETESNMVREELGRYLSVKTCDECKGSRLRLESRNVFIENISLPDINHMTIRNSLLFFRNLTLEGKRAEIAEKILKEITARLGFLMDVGLDYLTLNRSAETLSGGEAQRIRLASQIGSGLMGVMYILDEPSIGLHQRDNDRLLKTLLHLRDLGNTVIVVEHDEDAILTADYVIDIGPGAGIHGGHVVAKGKPQEIKQNQQSLTGKYLSGQEKIPVPKQRIPFTLKPLIRIRDATRNNLKKVNVDIPVGLLTCITGVSGSGKSSLINDTLYPLAAKKINGSEGRLNNVNAKISGLDNFDKVVDIDQSPIGRTPRSNPATYTGLFTPIREIFAATTESRSRGYQPGRFSFNVAGGRCEACEGDGVIKVEMHFLADIYVTCDVCKGMRYNRQTLEVEYKGKNIFQVLSMNVEEARTFFDAIPLVARKLQTLIDVGLSYITLGQSATTLSGGEAQRIKLSRELSRRDTGNTLYILDEPTTGLHFHDINQLLKVLLRLRDHGNTIIVIEHNLDVIKVADWIIDLGPEGGDGGGKIVAVGTPETVAENSNSYTGQFLKSILAKSDGNSC